MALSEQSLRYLHALYQPSDIVTVVGPRPDTVTYVGPVSAIPAAAEYICLNPLSTTRRLAVNVAAHRSFLIEFDNSSLEQQLHLTSILEKVISIRTNTYSGNKSYALIVSLADTLIGAGDPEIKAFLYKEYAQRFQAAATAYLTPHLTEQPTGPLVDSANVDASRLTRFAGAINRQWKQPELPHREQTLVSVGGLITAEQFTNFIQIYEPPPRPSQIFRPRQIYNSTFEKTLINQSHLMGLRSVLMCPESWAGANGNHPHMYRYTMWAIDATGVSQGEFLTFIQKYTAPYICSLGYSFEQLEAAIVGAYKIKSRKGIYERKNNEEI